ncbi:MAG: ABC transporter ATP-binding protein [Afipia sp.]|nr:ABC transporter ATP-binding protein [Afipia sp.]
MLKVENLRAGYGKVSVLHGLSFEVNRGECVALIGANGSGKTTTLKCICGLLPVEGGTITFHGKPIQNLKGHDIARMGITMCPEGRQVFPEMSVLENLKMGAYARSDAEQNSDFLEMLNMFPILRERSDQQAGRMSGGEQEMPIARIKAKGMTILLVEQNSAMALRLADRAYLYETGEIVLQGTGAELEKNPAIAKAYLGQ